MGSISSACNVTVQQSPFFLYRNSYLPIFTTIEFRVS